MSLALTCKIHKLVSGLSISDYMHKCLLCIDLMGRIANLLYVCYICVESNVY